MRRNAAPYVIASLFLPGLGSPLLGRVRNGLVLMGTTIGCWVAWMIVFVTLIPSFPAPTRRGFLVVMAIFWPIGMVAWVLGIVDAVRGTQAWNREHGLPE